MNRVNTLWQDHRHAIGEDLAAESITRAEAIAKWIAMDMDPDEAWAWADVAQGLEP